MKKLSFYFIVLFSSVKASGQTPHIVISEIYGGGGNSGATYTHDFIELYNPTSSPVSLSGWAIQYVGATATTWVKKNLTTTTTIPAHGFYLIQGTSAAAIGSPLPVPDESGTALSLAATAGKVALTNTTTLLTSTSPAQSSIVDFVAYGSTADTYKGTGPAPAPSAISSVERKASATSTAITMLSGGIEYTKGNGYDSGDNSFDFIAQSSINPQNSGSGTEVLPVSLISLTAKKTIRGAELNWSTASEHNSSHFEILRSINGNAFFKIGQVTGSNNCIQAKNYSFTDLAAYPGVNYYQLKQVDFNGDFEIYGPVSVNIDRPLSDNFTVYPTASKVDVSLELSSNPTNAVIAIYDIAGNRLNKTEATLVPGQNTISLTAKLMSGLYFVTIFGHDLCLAKKFVKN